MNAIERNLAIFGAEQPPLPPLRLLAGALTAEFEPDTGYLRYVRLGGMEVVRAVYGTVRGPGWETPVARFGPIAFESTADGFELSVDVEVDTFRWRIECRGREGEIEYVFDGEATTDLRTNRTGLCVLHPEGLGGQPCQVRHVDGSLEEGVFPKHIEPHQPFFEVRSIAHRPFEGAEVTVTMEGEVFEMEDQRNWSDGSFKTYCRPHSWPKPYPLAKGERVRHVVRISATASTPQASEDGPIALQIEDRVVSLPSIGTVAEDETGLEELRLGHLRSPVARFEDHTEEVLTFADGTTVTVCGPPEYGKGDCLGAHDNFTELNRCRPAAPVKAVSFGMSPQVHAYDTRSIMEQIPVQKTCVETARSFHGGDIHVGPIVLKGGSGDEPRMRAWVVAGWLLGSIAALAEAGAASATYFTKDGILGGPAVDLLRDLAGAEKVRLARVSDPLACAVLTIEGESPRTLLANLTANPIQVTIPALREGGKLRIRNGEVDTIIPFAETLELPPHAYARIDWI